MLKDQLNMYSFKKKIYTSLYILSPETKFVNPNINITDACISKTMAWTTVLFFTVLNKLLRFNRLYIFSTIICSPFKLYVSIHWKI